MKPTFWTTHLNKFHRECSFKCQGVEPRCELCPKDSIPMMEWKPVKTALILSGVSLLVFLYVVIN